MKILLIISACLSLLIVSLSVAYYFALFLPQQEKARAEQQKALSEEKKAKEKLQSEQKEREYVAKRRSECYEIYEKERKQWNNVDGNFYDRNDDQCVIRYTTDEYKGVDCEKKYKGIDSLIVECQLGIFTKRF
jgi:hypothetical protein